MVSALARKSITDLSRRKARAFFAVATLALAVASIGIFAMPDADGPLDAGGGQGREAGRPHRLTHAPRARPRAAGGARGAAERARGRAAHRTSTVASTSARGARTAYVIGVPRLRRAARRRRAPRLRRRRPRDGEVLTEVQNANQRAARRRAPATPCRSSPRAARRGRCASAARAATSTAAQDVAGDDVDRPLRDAADGRRAERRLRATTSLAFRLDDTRPAAIAATTTTVRRALSSMPRLRRLHVAAGGARARATGPASPTSRRSPTSSP